MTGGGVQPNAGVGFVTGHPRNSFLLLLRLHTPALLQHLHISSPSSQLLDRLWDSNQC